MTANNTDFVANLRILKLFISVAYLYKKYVKVCMPLAGYYIITVVLVMLTQLYNLFIS